MNRINPFLSISILAAILSSVVGQGWRTTCPKPCRCTLDRSPQQTYSLGPGAYKQVDCRYGNLFNIPPNLPSDTQVLLLSNNFINAITPLELEQLPNLKKLDLSHNYITDIVPETFKFNVDLRLLNLGWNQIVSIANSAFDGLNNLSRLLLSSNQLVDVPAAIQNLVSLVLLELSRNQIVSVNQNSFAGLGQLQFLNLRSNQLEMIAPLTFNELRSLVNLHLTANKLKQLPPNVFRNLNNLADISVGMNDLEQIPVNVFQGLRSVRHIDLHNNKLTHLPPTLFQGNSALQEIDLKGNNIFRVPATLFRGLQNLRSFEFSGNDLLEPLPANLFYGLRSLESVDFHLVQYIPPAIFAYVPQLASLQITESDMPILSDRMFQNLPNLQSLVLRDNGIGIIPPGTLNRLPSLRALDLSANALTALNETTFGGMYELRELLLQDNLITSVSHGAFSSMTRLQTLRLDINFLRELRADAMPHIAAIQTLQLAENPLERVDGAMFTRLPQLSHMTLGSTRLICDCHMAEFARWMQGNKNKIGTASELVCASPSGYRNRPLMNIVSNPRNPFRCAYPAITTTPRMQQKSVSIGATFTLPCALNRQAAARTRWQLPNRPGLSVPSYRQEATYDPIGHLKVNADGSLVVYNASAEDSGLYYCNTRNSIGSDNITYTVLVLSPNAPTAPGILPKIPPVESTAQGNTTFLIPKPQQPTHSMPPTRRTYVGPAQATMIPQRNNTRFGVTAKAVQPGQGPRKTTLHPLAKNPKTGEPKMADRTLVPTFASWTTRVPGQKIPWGTAMPPIFGGSTDSPLGTIVPNLKCIPNPCKNGGTCNMVPSQNRDSESENISSEKSLFAAFNKAFESRKPRSAEIAMKNALPPSKQIRCTCPKKYGGPLCQIRKPNNPSKVAVVESTNDLITLSWSQVAKGNVAGYRVFYSLVGDRTVVKSIPIHPDVNLYSMSKLKKDSTYRICVIAFNRGGESSIGEENCIWAETVTQNRNSNPIFSTQFIAIAAAIVSLFAIVLFSAYCYLRSKKKQDSYEEAVVVPRQTQRPASAAAEVFRRSLRRPMASYYSNMDDLMLIDMNQQTNRQMYMNPFDARHSAMLHDMESRRPTQSQPTQKIFTKPNQRRTLRIQEDTVL